MNIDWTAEQVEPSSHVIRIPFIEKAEWSQSVLLTSDRHWDHPNSRLDLQQKHLEEARERGAPVIDLGDLFCVMQGQKDKRANKKDIRDEHNTDTYLDDVVNTAVDFFAPYKENIALIGRGNHDQGIKKHHETDITRRFCVRLGCYTGGYRGWVRFLFQGAGNTRRSIKMFYTHGSGGGAPVTKGVIKTNRRAVYLPDADIIASGHIHNSWIMEIPRLRITDQGRTFKDVQYHVQCGTYKDEFDDISEGWVNEREMAPGAIGAWWINFYFQRKDKRIKFKFERAD